MGVPILPTISTTFIVISAVLVAIGWGLIFKRKVEAHKKVGDWLTLATDRSRGIGINLLHYLCIAYGVHW